MLINRIACEPRIVTDRFGSQADQLGPERVTGFTHRYWWIGFINKPARMMWELIENVQTKCGGGGRGVYLNGQGSCSGNGITTDYATKSSLVRNNCNFIEDS